MKTKIVKTKLRVKQNVWSKNLLLKKMFGQKNFGKKKKFLGGGCGVQKFWNRTDPTVGQNKFVKKKNLKILYKKFFGQQKS